MNQSILERKMAKKCMEEEQMGEPPTPPPEARKNLSLSSKLEELDEKLDTIAGLKGADKEFKKKSFKIPFKVKSQLKKGLLKNKIQVLLLRMNKTILPTIGEFKLGQLTIGENVWTGEEDIIWNWNGKVPTAIVPEWDLTPLTRGALIKECVEGNRSAAASDIIIRKMAATDAMAQEKKKMDFKMLIWIFIIGAAGLWIMFGGG